jgi:hypothetical protein
MNIRKSMNIGKSMDIGKSMNYAHCGTVTRSEHSPSMETKTEHGNHRYGVCYRLRRCPEPTKPWEFYHSLSSRCLYWPVLEIAFEDSEVPCPQYP